MLEPDDLVLEPEDLLLEPDERDTELFERLLLELDERDTEPVDRLLEPVEPDTEPDERLEPLFTVPADLREPEVVTVPEPERVELLELEPLTERELTDLEEELEVVRVRPVEASLEPTALVDPLTSPVF